MTSPALGPGGQRGRVMRTRGMERWRKEVRVGVNGSFVIGEDCTLAL